jgi:hypothetical protein
VLLYRYDGPHSGALDNTASLSRFPFDVRGKAVANGTLASDAANNPLGGRVLRLLDFPPTLEVARSTTNAAMIYWPSFSTDWNLQASTNFPRASRVTPPEPVLDDGINKYLIVTHPAGGRFFRLAK